MGYVMGVSPGSGGRDLPPLYSTRRMMTLAYHLCCPLPPPPPPLAPHTRSLLQSRLNRRAIERRFGARLLQRTHENSRSAFFFLPYPVSRTTFVPRTNKGPVSMGPCKDTGAFYVLYDEEALNQAEREKGSSNNTGGGGSNGGGRADSYGNSNSGASFSSAAVAAAGAGGMLGGSGVLGGGGGGGSGRGVGERGGGGVGGGRRASAAAAAAAGRPGGGRATGRSWR